MIVAPQHLREKIVLKDVARTNMCVCKFKPDEGVGGKHKRLVTRSNFDRHLVRYHSALLRKAWAEKDLALLVYWAQQGSKDLAKCIYLQLPFINDENHEFIIPQAATNGSETFMKRNTQTLESLSNALTCRVASPQARSPHFTPSFLYPADHEATCAICSEPDPDVPCCGILGHAVHYGCFIPMLDHWLGTVGINFTNLSNPEDHGTWLTSTAVANWHAKPNVGACPVCRKKFLRLTDAPRLRRDCIDAAPNDWRKEYDPVMSYDNILANQLHDQEEAEQPLFDNSSSSSESESEEEEEDEYLPNPFDSSEDSDCENVHLDILNTGFVVSDDDDLHDF